MKLKLEELDYQQRAIESAVEVFEGTIKNTFDNASFSGIRTNFCQLTAAQFTANALNVVDENGISKESAKYLTALTFALRWRPAWARLSFVLPAYIPVVSPPTNFRQRPRRKVAKHFLESHRTDWKLSKHDFQAARKAVKMAHRYHACRKRYSDVD